MAQHVFQPPTGTRDLYPIEAARRRFIMEAWRRVSINHGFEEIDGPTFEHLDLYKVKSGEGIVNELFSFTRAGGEKDYALRPEFTPTLARMYAAKAASLPKPTKWFTAGPFFRAERPQRGRLREFLQWNCDIMGLALPEKPTEADIRAAKARADTELLACMAGFLSELGLSPRDCQIRFNSREVLERRMDGAQIPAERRAAVMGFLDGYSKLDEAERRRRAQELQLSDAQIGQLLQAPVVRDGVAVMFAEIDELIGGLIDADVTSELEDWLKYDPSIARGLAYYTGMVFEVIVDGERAVAGGGRYDNLIELFGGPPTPAVGFGMGDVVLSLVLQDKGLMPSDDELLGLAGQNPDVFVISNGTPEADGALPGVLASLRRGEPRAPASNAPPLAGLHARRSYKTTKNVGKLLQDAVKARARFAVIIESATEATIKDLKSGIQDQHKTPLAALVAEIRARRGT